MQELIPIVEELEIISNQINSHRLVSLAKFLKQRISIPDTYLVFLGETCSGKSTLINQVIKKNVLPVSGVPSTGTITEVCFDIENKSEYFAINKDASMEVIDENLFKELSLKPDSDLLRLRYVSKNEADIYQGIRLFDTPGYGSLIKEHGEVLTEFLPNCDAVVYVVSYRNGFQEEDYEFLKGMLNLTRKGVPFYLIINRCPQEINVGNRRVKEINDYVTSLLEVSEVPITLLKSFVDNTAEIEADMSLFMQKIVKDLNSECRQHEMYEIFREYVLELIAQIKAEVERLKRNKEFSDEERNSINQSLQDLINKCKEADDNIVKPGFAKIRDKFPIKVEQSRQRVEKRTNEAIDQQSKLTKDETSAYIKMHVLNYNAQQEVKELQMYLETSINAIDEEVNNYLNTAFVQFEADLKLKTPGATYEAGMSAAKGLFGRLVNGGLLSYFAKYGGAGGSSAGIANAASHALKKIGQLFGKSFSRETHNALKHMLKTLGLTSTKVLSVAAAAIIDIVVEVVDLNLWKTKLKKQVQNTTKDWAKELVSVVNEDLKNLEWENIKNIRKIGEDFESMFCVEDDAEIDIDFDAMLDRISYLERRV